MLNILYSSSSPKSERKSGKNRAIVATIVELQRMTHIWRNFKTEINKNSETCQTVKQLPFAASAPVKFYTGVKIIMASWETSSL